jgi:hypothetical protein
LIWNWWGVPGALVLVLAWSAAGIALRAAPGRLVNRQLAVVLLLEGVYGAGNFGLIFFVTDPGAASIFARLGAVAMATLPLQYLIFLGVSLGSPMGRPFGSRPGRSALHVLTGGAVLALLVAPGLFITDVFSPAWAPWNFTYVGWGPRVVQFHGVVSLFGLIVSVDAFRRAPPNSAARNQAGWFIVAFGIRDAFIAAIQVLMPYLRPIPYWGDLIYNPLHGMMYVTYVPLLAYAILRHQLLDIDLRVRLALTQGTVGALLAGTFLIASELIESVVQVEGAVLGVILALVIAGALRPAQRFAERLISAAMPGVRPDEAYLQRRRCELLRGAIENAWADGDLSDKERGLVRLLREELGVETQVAAEIEAEVLENLGVRSATRAF